MAIISENIVTETYKEVVEFTSEQAHSEMTGLSEIQPNLVAFMVEFTQDLEPEVIELALYCFFTIFKMGAKEMFSIRHPVLRFEFRPVVFY